MSSPMTVCNNGGRRESIGTREAFARVVDAIIARGEKPTAYSTYDLKQVVLPKDS